MEYSGFREVIPDQTAIIKWNELTLNTGGTQSTLQDFKFAERKGGYSYKDQRNALVRNRFIYWRVYNDILELVEQSLDFELSGNRVRYKFTDSPVLDGVSVHEVGDAVFVLVATVSSVHRLSFPHPSLINSRNYPDYPRAGFEYTAPSIFAEASRNDARNPTTFYVLNNTYSSTPPPHTSATGLSFDEEESLFALAYSSGSILLVRLNASTGLANVTELSQHSDALMPRFLSRALRGKTNEDIVPVSLLLHPLDGETLLFSLCRDGNVRVWSTLGHQCAVVTEFPPNPSQGAQPHLIKKAVGVRNELYIGILHCYASHSVIHILEPSSTLAFKLSVVLSVRVPDGQDVVDFAITANLEVWTVLRSAAGETSLSVCVDNQWENCILEAPFDTDEPLIDPELDPKENYLNLIFYPGRFPVAVINKALSIYRKANIATDAGLSLQVLKERVCAVVDAEVHGEMRERQLSVEEMTELQMSSWQRFYSCVVEYYESGTRPLGLLVLSHGLIGHETKPQKADSMEKDLDESNEPSAIATSGVVLIKKEYISLIRPMDNLESIALNPKSSTKSNVPKGIVELLPLISFLDDNLPEECKLSFEKGLKQKSPMSVISEIYSKEVSIGDDETVTRFDVVHNVALNLEGLMPHLEEYITSLLDILEVTPSDVDPNYNFNVVLDQDLSHLSNLFKSQLGISFVATGLLQILHLRFQLCRGLLLLEHLYMSPTFDQYRSSKRRRKKLLSQDLIERTAHLSRCYYVLLWIAQTPIHAIQALDNFDCSASILKLNDGGWALLSPQYGNNNKNITLLNLFLQSTASSYARIVLFQREVQCTPLYVWRFSFLPFVEVLTQLLYPVCVNTIFPEFLLFSGQHLHVQEYTRMLSKWCHSNSYTRKFLLACSLLDTGEHYKAFELFNKAAHGLAIDPFFKKKVVRDSESLVLYYVQVMKLFEQQGLHDLVVELAQTAISVAEADEPELPTLHSVAFLHQLQLGTYEAAYHALLANPDAERRKDCLQQLVVTLVEGRRLDVLISFPYDGIRPELERIIEARARSMDVMNNLYYNFAYSFHTRRKSMRKAGCVMYEQALRLSSETSSEALEHQCHCYVAAINALSLVKPEDAWIVKPLLVLDDAMDATDMDGNQLERKVEVLELSDLKKEYALCRARSKLIVFSPEHAKTSTPNPNPHELVGVLTNAGLYKDALAICSLFGVPKPGVFSGLAGVCVRLDETPDDAAWDWLRENDAADLGCGGSSTLAWRLLECLLMREEPGKSSCLHRAVTTKLLHLGVFLPYWLVASYKKRNAAELLRLLLAAGRLEEAADLGIANVEAVLGKGKEHFGLDTSLLPQNPAVWLPHNTLDLLLLELKTHSADDDCYAEAHKRLEIVLQQYMKTVSSVSDDRFKMLQQAMRVVTSTY